MGLKAQRPPARLLVKPVSEEAMRAREKARRPRTVAAPHLPPEPYRDPTLFPRRDYRDHWRRL